MKQEYPALFMLLTEVNITIIIVTTESMYAHYTKHDNCLHHTCPVSFTWCFSILIVAGDVSLVLTLQMIIT